MIVFAEEALADLERDPASAPQHVETILEAVLILDGHPEIGRSAGTGSPLREMVISHGSSGYVALYEYSRVNRLIRVLAVRHQREAGYRGG